MTISMYGFPVNAVLTEQQLTKISTSLPMALVKIHQMCFGSFEPYTVLFLALRIQLAVDDRPVCQLPAVMFDFIYGLPFRFVHPILVHSGELFNLTIENASLVTGAVQFYFEGEILYG